MPRRVCVYCASSDRLAPVYLEAAAEMGTTIAAQGDTLVYGAANCGSMGTLVRAAMAGGAHIHGVVPENIHAMGVTEMAVQDLEVVPDLRVRKARMMALADAFVVLPGGIGTMDEFFETLSMKYFREHHDKPLVLVNINGGLDGLLALMESLYREQFTPAKCRRLYQVVDRVDQVYAAFAEEAH